MKPGLIWSNSVVTAAQNHKHWIKGQLCLNMADI